MPRKNYLDREIDGLILRMQNKAKTARRAGGRRLESGALFIRDLARDYAPVDEGNLEEAIKVHKERDGRVNEYWVYVDGDMPGSNGKDRLVKHYATKMHEGVYNLGPKSADKDRALGGNGLGYLYGGKVGPHFLSRAYERVGPKIESQVRDAVKRGLR